MIKLIVVALALFMIVGVTIAQQCDHNLPCGRVPWDMPSFPLLLSPTKIPTVVATSVGGNPLTPTSTPTPSPTGTFIFDPSDLNDQLGTLQAIAGATPMQADNPNTPANFGESVTLFFGYARGISTISFGVFTPIVGLIFFGFFFWLGLQVLFFLLPVISSLIGVIRKVLNLVLEFLPG